MENQRWGFASYVSFCCAMLSHSVATNSLWPRGLRRPGPSVHGDSLGKKAGMGFHALLQGPFQTQGSNPVLPYCKWILYQLNYQGSPMWALWTEFRILMILTHQRMRKTPKEIEINSRDLTTVLENFPSPDGLCHQGYHLDNGQLISWS